jgi:ribonuclease J
MVSLTFYGGVNEIGGNKILLHDGDTKIFLDFGMSFSRANQYFSEFLQPRKCNAIGDLEEFGLLPKLNGLYRRDFVKHMGRDFEAEPMIQAVLLSHAHADHSAYINHLRHDIPIFCSKSTKLILQAIQDTSQSGFVDFLEMVENFQIYINNKDEWSRKTKQHHYDDIVIKRDVKTFAFGEKLKIDSLEVYPYSVDHSLAGATGFIIHTSEGAVVYTGDIRFHGRRGSASEVFVEKCAEAKPVAMISEGTRINEKQKQTEVDVEKKVAKIGCKCKGLIVADWPVRDTDRMLSFLNASKMLGRKLAISTRQAHLLNLLKECKDSNIPRLDDENICVYNIRKGWGVIRKDFPQRIKEMDYESWEKPFLNVCAEHECVSKDPSKYVWFCSNFDLKELIDIKPKNAFYVKSTCEPFDVEMEIEQERINNWINHFNIRMFRTHVSGHASGTLLKKAVKNINPKVLFPVHTEHPGMFRRFARTKVVKYGKEYKIK